MATITMKLDSFGLSDAGKTNYLPKQAAYQLDLELYDRGVRAQIPDGATIAVKCKKNEEGGTIYTMDNTNPKFSTIVTHTQNLITITSWPELVSADGDMILQIDVNGTKYSTKLTVGRTSERSDEQIRDLFFTNRYEETASIDFTTSPYKDLISVYIVYQLTLTNQVINQQLPPVASNKNIMVELIRSTGVTGGKVEFTASGNDTIEGSSTPFELTEEKVMYRLLPLINENSWELVKLNADNNILAVDGILNKDFKVSKMQSLDKSIRISELPNGTADFSVRKMDTAPGIFAMLGNLQPINTNFNNQKFYYSNRYINGGDFIGVDIDDKAYTIQDGTQDDPNVTGGTSMRLGSTFYPTNKVVASEDGYIELKVVDITTGDYLIDDNGEKVTDRKIYKAGDIIQKQKLVRSIKAKGQQKISFELDCSFKNDIIVADGKSSIYIQVVDNNNPTGLAEIMFKQINDLHIDSYVRYYGYNWMNLAAALVYSDSTIVIPPKTVETLGNGLYIASPSGCTLKTENNTVNILPTGNTIPVWEIGQISDGIDAFYMSEKNINVKVDLKNTDTAFIYALMNWTGTGEPVRPIITSYSEGSPVFAQGWTKVAEKFVRASSSQDFAVDRNAFTVPVGSRIFAVIGYAAESEIVGDGSTGIALKDFEVDVMPQFNKDIIRSSDWGRELHIIDEKYAYRGLTKTPDGDAALRYTINKADTKLPFGIVSGGDDKLINNRAWNSSGNTWTFEGDGEAKADGTIIDLTATVPMYCGESIGKDEETFGALWFAKSNNGANFVEIPNSRVEYSIEETDKGVRHLISTPKVTFKIKNGESIRLFANSNKDDGAFIQSNLDGTPTVRIDFVFDELEEIDERIIDLINAKK